MRQCTESVPRAWAWLSVLAVVLASGSLLTTFAVETAAVAAEEDVPAEAPAPAEPAPAEPAPAEPAPAQATDEAPREICYLAWVYDACGPGYTIIFLGLSFTLVALFVMNVLTARRDNVCPQHLLESFEAHLNEQRYQEAYELAKADESMLGMVLSAGLAKLSMGYSQALEAMQEVGEDENMKLEHRLSYMALIGTISPMIGLFGTVHGMISSFQVIAVGGQK